MDETPLQEHAKTCEGCLGWLNICQAQCCRMFQLRQPEGWDVKAGDKITYRGNIPPYMQYYYKLHGAELKRGALILTLNEFKVQGDMLIVFAKCRELGEDSKCRIHENKPFVCSNYTQKTYSEGKYLAPMYCLFRYKNKETKLR